MINSKKWKQLLKNKFNFINETAYGKRKKSMVFQKKELTTGKTFRRLGKFD